MYKSYLLISLIVCVIMMVISCGDGVIGSKSNRTISHIEWSLGTLQDSTGYVVTNSGLKATGTITNVGDTTILAPWYVEAEFYEDSTFSFILGGDQQYHDVNLYVNVGRPWTLEFSSSDIDEWNYTDFAIKNFRAFIKK